MFGSQSEHYGMMCVSKKKKKHHIMKRVLFSVITVCLAVFSCAANAALEAVANQLSAVPCATAQVDYQVLLPSAPDPVVYTITIAGTADSADTIAGCKYLIDWKLPRPKGVSNGFAAYYDGNHYRYRDTKLQEYHYGDDPTPFRGDKGVAVTAQFADMVPQIMAQHLKAMNSDSTYVFTVKETADKVTIEGVRRIEGYDAVEYTYVFDNKTSLPISLDRLFNPASISEQSVTATFTWNTDSCITLSEENLISLYPEVFDKYRVSNFKINSMIGVLLPSFTAKQANGSRFYFDRTKGFSMPTVLAFVDPSATNTMHTLGQVRDAIGLSATPIQLILAIADNDPHVATALTSDNLDETFLMGAKSLMRDCGVTVFPSLIFCNTDGTVAQTELGSNNNLTDIVIQKATLCH